MALSWRHEARTLVRRWQRTDDGDRGRDQLLRPEGSLSTYEQLLDSEAHIADVPANVLKAICWYASGWRQYEPSGRVLTTPVRGGTHLYGCMQLSEEWHPDAFPAAKSDAQASIRYAANLLRWLYEQFDDWHRATVAFFGHDRRAETAARRVRRYADERPWAAHTTDSQRASERLRATQHA